MRRRWRRRGWFGALEVRSPIVAWLSSVSANRWRRCCWSAASALLFYFIPNTKVRFRDVWPGALLVGLLWRGALSAFSWYARDLAAWNVIHGSVTAVVIFLLWIYVSAVILLYGVEMTAAYARLRTRPSGTRTWRHRPRTIRNALRADG